MSQYTLRYYEKIGLLPPISKDKGGRRVYCEQDLNRLSFIKRAQRMHFSLKDIAQLIDLEKSSASQKPLTQKKEAQELVQVKLEEIADSLRDLHQLQGDLSSMLEACMASAEDQDCPIIERIKETK